MASNILRVTFETWVGDAHNTDIHEEEAVSNQDIVDVQAAMIGLLSARKQKGEALAGK